MSTVKINFRVSDETLEFLTRTATETNQTFSDVARGFIPAGEMRAALEEAAGPNSPTDEFFELVGDGLKHRMENGTPRIDPAFLALKTGRGQMPAAYLEYCEALRNKIGALNQAEPREPRFYFATPPGGGEWERRGIVGAAVLPKGAVFTPDGLSVVSGERTLYFDVFDVLAGRHELPAHLAQRENT